MKIPLILHQIWYQGRNNIEEPYKRCFDTVIKGVKNTKWEHIYWDKYKIEKLILKHYPQYWELYNYLPFIIQKIDISRYIILYHYGGCYLDMDVEWIRDFSVLIDMDDELIFSYTMQGYVNNGVLISSPKNRFWIDFINVINNKRNKRIYYDKFIYVQNSTGPLRFNIFIKNNKDKFRIKILEYKYLEPCKSKYNTSVTDDAYLINYFANSWINPIYESIIYIYTKINIIGLLSLISILFTSIYIYHK